MQEHWLKLVGERDLKNVKKAKLTKKNLKAFLVGKYESVVAEKILKVMMPAFKMNKEGKLFFEEFVRYLTDLINDQTDTLYKLAFAIYDFNDDNQICELDVVSFFKDREHPPDLEQIYMKDITLIINAL